MKLKTLDVIAAVLLVVGGLNWGLVSVAHFDLVAAIFGMKFGETSTLSSVVYALGWPGGAVPGCLVQGHSASLGTRVGSGSRSLAEGYGRTGEDAYAFSPHFYSAWESRTLSLDPRITVRNIRGAESRRKVRSLLDAARPEGIGQPGSGHGS